MKTLSYLMIVCFMMMANMAFARQTENVDPNDSTGLAGDNFSLQGALEMFKLAATPEDFEKSLNIENNYVNNLDLDGDDNTDYINVIDRTDGSSHAIVLQVQVSETESQDVAVIEIEKNGTESAMLQIIGDEELYGDSAIVEPIDVTEKNSDENGPFSSVNNLKIIIVNVWLWPCIKYIYAPAYVVYTSPWKWHHYPAYWKPWRPLGWRAFYGFGSPYRIVYRPVFIHRVVKAHTFYRPFRRTSVIVVTRYRPAHQYYQAHHNRPFFHRAANNPTHTTPRHNNRNPHPNNNRNHGRPGGR